jgi:hypothetical protein
MPARRGRAWWRRLPAFAAPRQPSSEVQHAYLERLLALLEAARTQLSAGWVQDGWWTSPADGGQQILVTGLAAGTSAPATAGAVCLVGALIRAGARQGGDSEAGRAIDVLYDALWESRGQPAAMPGPSVLAVSCPQVRQAKIQALTRWNDAQGRTGKEVLAVLDRAIARVIQNLAAIPAPGVPAGRLRPIHRHSKDHGRRGEAPPFTQRVAPVVLERADSRPSASSVSARARRAATVRCRAAAVPVKRRGSPHGRRARQCREKPATTR